MGGSRPKVPPPPPPPPLAKDESDVVGVARLLAQRQAAATRGFRSAFLSGPRGPGGPTWQAPEVPGTVPSTPLPPDGGPEDVLDPRREVRLRTPEQRSRGR